MKALELLLVISFVFTVSCEKNEETPSLQDFCNVIPNDWECEIIEDNFDLNDIPQNAQTPVAIVKYKNLNKEYTIYRDTRTNPSLILDLYPIEQKDTLIEFIKSQEYYSWCIPIYYGETPEYFIVTSPCFMNRGTFTEEANETISDLYESLEKIITVKDYDLLGY